MRQAVSCISQEAKLFDGSVRDNLFYANPHLSHEELDEVVKVSGLDKLLNSQPMGLDLPVGEGGSQLSGGQRQLVAIAQAVAKNPPIILMDEPTSSLDTGAEAEFLAKMKEFTKDKTLILSTHKMRELQLVDRIIVLDKGLMIADGPRDKVLEV
ncbi:ABC transporter related protein, partial [Lentisphaera araneosa HTCC2155]